jgi:hypothetical protein
MKAQHGRKEKIGEENGNVGINWTEKMEMYV